MVTRIPHRRRRQSRQIEALLESMDVQGIELFVSPQLYAPSTRNNLNSIFKRNYASLGARIMCGLPHRTISDRDITQYNEGFGFYRNLKLEGGADFDRWKNIYSLALGALNPDFPKLDDHLVVYGDAAKDLSNLNYRFIQPAVSSFEKELSGNDFAVYVRFRLPR